MTTYHVFRAKRRRNGRIEESVWRDFETKADALDFVEKRKHWPYMWVMESDLENDTVRLIHQRGNVDFDDIKPRPNPKAVRKNRRILHNTQYVIAFVEGGTLQKHRTQERFKACRLVWSLCKKGLCGMMYRERNGGLLFEVLFAGQWWTRSFEGGAVCGDDVAPQIPRSAWAEFKTTMLPFIRQISVRWGNKIAKSPY